MASALSQQQQQQQQQQKMIPSNNLGLVALLLVPDVCLSGGEQKAVGWIDWPRMG